MTSASTFSDQPESSEAEKPFAQATPPSTNDTQLDTVGEPSIDDSITVTLHGRQPPHDQVQVTISQVALKQVEGHSMGDMSRELGGVLMGQFIQEDDTFLVKVEAVLPVKTDDHGPVHFTFTADAWAQLHQDRADHYPDLDIVGWFHTHPNLGVFYSADDVIVHSAAFVMPWQVGLVFDPILGEGCLVGWIDHSDDVGKLKLSSIDGFYELLDVQDTSVVNWRFVESAVWQQGVYTQTGYELSNQVYAPANDWPLLPAISPWWGVILGGLSLLISLLLLIDRLIAGVN
jgi:proteasome lid subunit RPN8/RPN11